jgi:hypothetical protein
MGLSRRRDQEGDNSNAAAANTILQHGTIEVKQQPERNATQSKIGQQLRFVNWNDAIDGFNFDDQAGIDDDINLVGVSQRATFISNWKLLLPRVRDRRLTQFKAQALLIDAFQQPRAELPMDFNRQTNNLT